MKLFDIIGKTGRKRRSDEQRRNRKLSEEKRRNADIMRSRLCALLLAAACAVPSAVAQETYTIEAVNLPDAVNDNHGFYRVIGVNIDATGEKIYGGYQWDYKKSATNADKTTASLQIDGTVVDSNDSTKTIVGSGNTYEFDTINVTDFTSNYAFGVRTNDNQGTYNLKDVTLTGKIMEFNDINSSTGGHAYYASIFENTTTTLELGDVAVGIGGMAENLSIDIMGGDAYGIRLMGLGSANAGYTRDDSIYAAVDADWNIGSLTVNADKTAIGWDSGEINEGKTVDIGTITVQGAQAVGVNICADAYTVDGDRSDNPTVFGTLTANTITATATGEGKAIGIHFGYGEIPQSGKNYANTPVTQWQSKVNVEVGGVTATSQSGDAYGIWGDDAENITLKGNISVNSEEGRAYGILAKNLDITAEGELTISATAKDQDQEAAGIKTTEDFTLNLASDASLTVNSTNVAGDFIIQAAPSRARAAGDGTATFEQVSVEGSTTINRQTMVVVDLEASKLSNIAMTNAVLRAQGTDSTEQTLTVQNITFSGDNNEIDVAEGKMLDSDAVYGEGNVTKTGAGTSIIDGLGITGTLNVNEGTIILNEATGAVGTPGSGAISESQNHPYLSSGAYYVGEASNIVIADGATLDVKDGAILSLTHDDGNDNDIQIDNGGKLRIEASDTTLVYHTRNTTEMNIDGGTVEFYNDDTSGSSTTMNAQTINTTVGESGGTFDIGANVTLQSGTLTADNANVTKTGAGRSEMDAVNLGTGKFTVGAGTVQFTNTAKVGEIVGEVGSAIELADSDTEIADGYLFNKFTIAGNFDGHTQDLTVGTGEVTGTMTYVGTLTAKETFDLGTGNHSAENLVVDGIFNLKAGASLELTNSTNEPDMTVTGVLNIESAANTGIYKSNANTSLFVDGGTVNIKKLEEYGSSTLVANTINTTFGDAGGTINIDEGLTFTSGTITGIETTAAYTKQGAGTHQVDTVAIAGAMRIDEGKTELSGTDNEAKTVIFAPGTGKTSELELGVGKSLEVGDIVSVGKGGTMTNFGNLTAGSVLVNDGGLLKNHRELTADELVLDGILDITQDSHFILKSLDVNSGGKITMDGGALAKGESVDIGDIFDVEELKAGTIDNLNNNQSGLFQSKWTWNDTTGSLSLVIENLTMEDFMNSLNMKEQNVLSLVNLLDEDPEMRALLQEMTTEQITTAVRAGLAGELVSNAARMVMSSPYRMVFQQLNMMPAYSRTANRIELGQVNTGSRLRLWFNPYAQSEKGDGDAQTVDGYDLTRVGFMLGGDVNVTERSAIGLVINYGNPNIESSLGEVSANDFMIGAYAKMPLFWLVNLNAMVGFGMQQYTYEGGGGKVDFDGDALFGSVELTRHFPMMTILKWTPVIGFDFQSVNMDSLAVTMPSLGGLPISPDGMDSAALRVGIRGELLRFRTRLQYLRQLSGDDFVTSTMALNNVSANVRSVQWGKDWVNFGIGGELIQTHAFRLFADYDLDVSKNTTSHLGSLSAVLMW